MVIKHTRLLASKEYAILKTVPGIGKIIGLVILYETVLLMVSDPGRDRKLTDRLIFRVTINLE